MDEENKSLTAKSTGTNINAPLPSFLTKMKKLTYIGDSLSFGFWDNMLNVIRYRKSFATLFEQVGRFRILDTSVVKSECRLNPTVFYKQIWQDYPREPKYYMMLTEICTHYFFKKKYMDHKIKDQMCQDLSLLSTNTIYAIIFFGESTSETYTVFTAKHILYASGFFEFEEEIFAGMEKLDNFLALKRLDSYDIFEFKVGQMSNNDVMVKYEDIQGDGSADKPIEFD